MKKKIIYTLAAVNIDEDVEEGGLYVKTSKRTLFCPTIVTSISDFNESVNNFLRVVKEKEEDE